MRLPCLARRWNSRKSGWIMESVHSRQFTVHSQKKEKPIITLLLPGPDYSSWADSFLEAGSAARLPDRVGVTSRRPLQSACLRGTSGKGGQINHNHPPPPCFFKSVDFKGTLSCF